ncbi:hypothetical protein C8J57DRAFT_1710546 [Mycena rebaudengoi]|nr:hypothetical protein C8J57DRAFT_1710546 [Mycena rebaudengoi]
MRSVFKIVFGIVLASSVLLASGDETITGLTDAQDACVAVCSQKALAITKCDTVNIDPACLCATGSDWKTSVTECAVSTCSIPNADATAAIEAACKAEAELGADPGSSSASHTSSGSTGGPSSPAAGGPPAQTQPGSAEFSRVRKCTVLAATAISLAVCTLLV